MIDFISSHTYFIVCNCFSLDMSKILSFGESDSLLLDCWEGSKQVDFAILQLYLYFGGGKNPL